MQTRKEFAATCILKVRQVPAQSNTLGMNARSNTDDQKSKKNIWFPSVCKSMLNNGGNQMV